MSTRARLASTAGTLRTVAVVAGRTPTLRVLAYDVRLEALRLLVDRRAELGRARTQCTTGQAKRILATVIS